MCDNVFVQFLICLLCHFWSLTCDCFLVVCVCVCSLSILGSCLCWSLVSCRSSRVSMLVLVYFRVFVYVMCVVFVLCLL